jgi:probable phosphomutase (TIGR03848 family)
MTTILLLVRHGAHDLLGKAMAGRAPGLDLNEEGRQQADQLVARLSESAVHAIYSSPRQRARETAAPLAAKRGLAIEIDEAFDEIDFGEWTGLTFDQLRADKERWQQWVEQKSVARPPGGESCARVQQRAIEAIERLTRLHPDQTVVVVSHGDVIKAVLASTLGISLDHLERFEIAPGSLSVLATGPGWSQVRLVNG